MNENIDLTKILKDCPEGTTFWSDIYGEVKFLEISTSSQFPIRTKRADGITVYFTKEGWFSLFPASCLLWPSKDCRDWSKFTAPWFKKKPKPKFLVGQYVTDGYMSGQITSIEDNYNCYKILDVMGDINTFIPFTLQDNYHLWAINDAKDGDVLAFSNDTIVIFKDLYNSTSFHSYCHIEDGIFDLNKDEVPDWWNSKGFKPATKEQRDLLFQKIREAGYKWNDETKTLEKLVKDKFDPKTLQPFDKVLAKIGTERYYTWFPDFISFPPNDINDKIACVGKDVVFMAIPYNDETKHLIDTNEEAPEYYRYWD